MKTYLITLEQVVRAANAKQVTEYIERNIKDGSNYSYKPGEIRTKELKEWRLVGNNNGK